MNQVGSWTSPGVSGVLVGRTKQMITSYPETDPRILADWLQITVFALLLIAAGLSGDAVTKSGIYQNLDNSFDFGSLAGLNDRDAFVSERIPSIAKASKDFFLLSSNYFVPGAIHHPRWHIICGPVWA